MKFLTCLPLLALLISCQGNAPTSSSESSYDETGLGIYHIVVEHFTFGPNALCHCTYQREPIAGDTGPLQWKFYGFGYNKEEGLKPGDSFKMACDEDYRFTILEEWPGIPEVEKDKVHFFIKESVDLKSVEVVFGTDSKSGNQCLYNKSTGERMRNYSYREDCYYANVGGDSWKHVIDLDPEGTYHALVSPLFENTILYLSTEKIAL